MRKGISPLIATVLLIAFTVAVAGVIGLWLTPFATKTTEDVSSHTDTEIYCSYGGVGISDMQYCGGWLSGIIQNTNLVDIGNITLQVTFLNATPAETVYLAQNGTELQNASVLALKPRQLASFNVSIGGSNYDKIHVYTNCTNVYDDASNTDVTVTC